MAGFTNFGTMKLNGKSVYVPIDDLINNKVKFINIVTH